MAKFCPVCTLVLLDAAGSCPSCREGFDAGGLPEATKYELARNLRSLQRVAQVRSQGGGGSGGGGGLGRLCGWLLRLAAVGLVAYAVMRVDYRMRPDLAGGFGAGAVVAWVVGSKFAASSSSAAEVQDTLRKDLDLAAQIRRIEEASTSG
ncbi:MAG: hypothetical protein HY816_02615 [Candidatus Wallbacteria bacterium]|nr:hypothetical protein [Candidatus Wallbacteria bacterium]